MNNLVYTSIFCLLFTGAASAFEKDIRPLLDRYCLECHGGEKVKGKVDFSGILSQAGADNHIELWETVAVVLEDHEMPPEDEKQPSASERKKILSWYNKHFGGPVEPRPGTFQPRRLSAPEYRNTIHSLFGFELEVNITAAEQTVVEKSLVIKLLPIDPPGASGFVNDTHGAPLSTTLWDQYSYLADVALEELFSPHRRNELATLLGKPLPENFQPADFTPAQAEALLRNFLPRAFRRPLSRERLAPRLEGIANLKGQPLVDATTRELKAALMSPPFLYRGLLMEAPLDKQQPVDDFELAERLSYFLWEDMPDAELTQVAASGTLTEPAIFAAQLDRLLASPKARTLSESFAAQWLTLNEIDQVQSDPTRQHALKSQPVDFLHYLFTENRPVIELIDSEVAFANYITAPFYGKDRDQMTKYVKPRGIERAIAPNQRIQLEHTKERGGILTMPGILAMNKGPVLRGTWMLRKILGVDLGEPPGDVPPIKTGPRNKKLTFRQRFEEHRADATCARCHNKIDPLGFAMQAYNVQGGYFDGSAPPSKKKNNLTGGPPSEKLDTSGRLPTGETFKDYPELKDILLTTKREEIIRNAVERTLAYALCRELERFDQPAVDAITARLDKNNLTWRDLFLEVASSLPFRETVIASKDHS